MRCDIFNQYYKSIEVLKSREMLIDMRVAMTPSMKDRARRDCHKNLHKVAYPAVWNNTPKITVDQFFGKPRVKSGE